MTHRLLCLLMHGRTSQITANSCVSLPTPQLLLLSQRISPLQANTSWDTVWALTSCSASVRPAVHVCSEPSPPQAPGCSCAQLCSSTPQEKPASQKSSLLKFLSSLSASKPSPMSYFKFPALSVRGELFCCFPAGKLHVGTSHPGHNRLEFPHPQPVII